VSIRCNSFSYLADKQLAPKAEVTGSNPVGCANIFNWLPDWFEGIGRGYFRIILVVVAPSVSASRIAQVSISDNWNWAAKEGASRELSGVVLVL
jgi:hypothetical protein